VVDWFSRRVLSWQVSITLEVAFCLDALEAALVRYGKPAIFNTDQGSQFTSADFTGLLSRSPSAWMAEAPGVTTCSSSASGVRSNTRRSTCVPTTASLRRVPRSVGISTSTIPLHHTHLAMSLMRRDFAVRVLVLWGPLRVVLRGGCWPWSLACREQRDRIATDHLEVDGSR